MTTLVRRLAIGIALTLTGVSCGKDPTATEILARDTKAAQKQWDVIRPARYSFEAFRVCECLADARGPVRVTVQNRSIVSVTRMDTGAAVDASLWFDVDALFALINSELTTQPTLLDARYDATFGFPSHVAYGHREYDAGAEIDVSAFQTLPN